jgi:hypothetical protein
VQFVGKQQRVSKNILPPSSVSKKKRRKKRAWSRQHAQFGADIFPRNFGYFSTDYTTLFAEDRTLHIRVCLMTHSVDKNIQHRNKCRIILPKGEHDAIFMNPYCTNTVSHHILEKYVPLSQADGGRTIAQAVSRWLPIAAARVRDRVWQVGFVVEKWRWSRFSPSTSVSPANLHSTKILHHLHNHPGQVL